MFVKSPSIQVISKGGVVFLNKKFLSKQGKTVQTILNEMGAVYGNRCPSKTMFYKWNGLIKQGRTSIEEDPRPGRPIEVTTSENIERVENIQKIVLESTTILRVLYDHLGDLEQIKRYHNYRKIVRNNIRKAKRKLSRTKGEENFLKVTHEQSCNWCLTEVWVRSSCPPTIQSKCSP